MSFTKNVSCKPYNLEAVAGGTENYVHIQSHWSPTNVTAMAKCWAPERAVEAGCFTLCRLGADDSKTASSVEAGLLSWKAEFRDCRTTEGRRLSGNASYVAPEVLVTINEESVAPAPPRVAGGAKGAAIAGLGVLYWVLGA
ncbi:hypothetical protein PG984_012219 [Apiospora sp. TS-2023a]